MVSLLKASAEYQCGRVELSVGQAELVPRWDGITVEKLRLLVPRQLLNLLLNGMNFSSQSDLESNCWIHHLSLYELTGKLFI